MVMMILEKVKVSLRGELTRWLIEVKPGVYIGHVNGMVRDKLWDYCCKDNRAGIVFQAWSANTEQHFKMRMNGDSQRQVMDWEGLQLIAEAKDELKAAQKRRVRKTE
jgi:CRISPR-associated protein Cas2